MPIPAIENLVDTLRTAGLLDASQLHDLTRTHEARLADPHEFGETMLRLGWLTPYQVTELLAGRGNELVLGQYLLLERLGEGGMGIVFKARHRNLGRVVAVKVLRKDRLSNPEAAARFRREIELASQLSHPNIVLAFDADQCGETHFFVMEYIDGIDLANLVRKAGPMGVFQACEYVRQAALGLQHAHERGLVHRDIKPSNLILQRTKGSRNGGGSAIKILDLGLARLQHQIADDNSRFLTSEGGVVGTVDFMAPEQADDARTVDIRADLYSLGCTFYYLLTRSVLFPGTSTAEKIFKHRYEPPPPLLRVRPEAPPAVVSIVYRLLAKRPENRFRTPGELAETLAALPPPAAVPIALPVEVRETVPDPLPLAIPVEDKPTALPVATTPVAEPALTGDMWSLSESTPTMAAIPRSNPVGQAGVAAFNRSGRRVAASRSDGSVRLWDLTGPQPREETTLAGHRDRVVALAFTPDDATFFSGGADGRVIWWDAVTHRRLREWQFPHPVAQAILAPDGGHIAIVVDNGATYILRLTPPEDAPAANGAG
jgi:serine/threonine protein kinase